MLSFLKRRLPVSAEPENLKIESTTGALIRGGGNKTIILCTAKANNGVSDFCWLF